MRYAMIALCILSAGCSPIWFKTVYVPDGQSVRLRTTLRNVKVWVKDKDGSLVPGRIDLPEGWYALPMPEE